MKSDWKNFTANAGNKICIVPEILIANPNITSNELRLLLVLSKNKDSYHPGTTQLVVESGLSKRTIINTLKSLEKKKFITRLPGGFDGVRQTYQTIINIEAILSGENPALVVLTGENHAPPTGENHAPPTGENHAPLTLAKDPSNNPSNCPDPMAEKKDKSGKKKPAKKPPRPHSLRLAMVWYDITTPTEKHNKETIIIEWARYLDTEQNVTGYSDDQMTEMVMFRNRDDFWRLKGAPRPSGLHKKGKDGVRKTIKIYEKYLSERPLQPVEPIRQLEPGELPF